LPLGSVVSGGPEYQGLFVRARALAAALGVLLRTPVPLGAETSAKGAVDAYVHTYLVIDKF
jgi:hypothetical protein